jgi:hypothetical protein
VLRVAFPVLVGNVLAHLGGATRTVVAETTPRSEITLTATTVTTSLTAPPEPRWRVPIAPTTLLAAFGAALLAFEAWFSLRRRSAPAAGSDRGPRVLKRRAA